MRTKLAGHLPLQDMISSVIDSARSKVAQAEREGPVSGEQTKTASAPASVIDPHNFDEIEKLASALDYVGDGLIKSASDSVENGGESPQGGEQLPTGNAVPGTQPYKKDGSKKHQVPMSTGLQASSDGGGATQVPNDAKKAPGGAPYPEKGVLKTASESVREKIEAAKALKSGEKPVEKKDEKKKDETEKTSSVAYILNKIAESAQGGMTLDSASGQGPKPPSDAKGGNDARTALESNSAATNMQKVDGKAPQKRQLSEVLTEPAQTKGTDSKVHENLRSASTGGVKIAAAKAFLSKIAQEGCTCDGAGTCEHCMLKKAVDKKKAEKKEKSSMSVGGTTMPSPMPAGGGLPPTTGM